jgi:hypothetical protein
MFLVVIETNMAASEGFGSFLVVFDVVGLETLICITDVHVTVSDEEVAVFLLRAARPDFDVTPFV